MPRNRGSPFLAVFAAVTLAGLVLMAAGFVLFSQTDLFRPSQPPPTLPPQFPQLPTGPQQPQSPPGRLQFQVQDADTGATLGATNVRVDIIDPADMNRPIETFQVNTNTRIAETGLLYTPGQRLLLRIYSSEGNGYYPALYEATVPSNYALVGNQYIYFLGRFSLKQRVAGTGIAFTLFMGSTALSSGTGTTSGSQGTATAPSKIFQLNLQINLNQYNVAWGRDVEFIDARLQRVTLKPVVWLSINQTGINTASLVAQGWTPVTTTAITGWLVFYKVLRPVESSMTQLGSLVETIQIDASSLPTGAGIRVLIHIADLQNPDEARAGIGRTTFPPYGAFSGYGLTAPLGRPFASSGGAPINPHLAAIITNA